MSVKYPQVKVELVGQDGNAFAILGRCFKAARRAGLTPEQIKEFEEEVTSGDYNHLLMTCMDYFDCDSCDDDDDLSHLEVKDRDGYYDDDDDEY